MAEYTTSTTRTNTDYEDILHQIWIYSTSRLSCTATYSQVHTVHVQYIKLPLGLRIWYRMYTDYSVRQAGKRDIKDTVTKFKRYTKEIDADEGIHTV